MYRWRTLTSSEREEVLASRVLTQRPWHSPPHWQQDGPAWFHLTGACYEHAPIIGLTASRLDWFASELLATADGAATSVAAWCILPNHYHLLVETRELAVFTRLLGQLHGRSARIWNLEEHSTGRKIFHRAADRHIRSDSHRWATLNYIHHNPVRHGYVARWTDWPWSSAHDYLRATGREEAAHIWRAYPLLDYGAGWDDPGA